MHPADVAVASGGVHADPATANHAAAHPDADPCHVGGGGHEAGPGETVGSAASVSAL